MMQKVPKKKSQKKAKNPHSEKEILRVIEHLEKGDTSTVKKFLLSLIPDKPKAKKTIREVAAIFRQDLVKSATNEELATRDILKEHRIPFKFQHVIFVSKSKFYITERKTHSSPLAWVGSSHT